MDIHDLASIITIIQGFFQAAKAITNATQRNELVIKCKGKLKLNPKPSPDFDSVYKHSLVEYGLGKPNEILDLFRDKSIRDTFREEFEEETGLLRDEIEKFLDTYSVGDKIREIGIDYRSELNEFKQSFINVVKKTIDPRDALQTRELKKTTIETGESIKEHISKEITGLKEDLLREENVPDGFNPEASLGTGGKTIGKIAWSTDGRYLVVPLSSGSIKTWELYRNRKFEEYDSFVLPSGNNEILTCVAVNQNITYAGSESGILYSFLPGARKLLEKPKLVHSRNITCMYLIQSNEMLFTGSDDKTIKIWRTNGLSEIKSALEHDGSVIDFTLPEKGGRAIVSIDSTGYLRFWWRNSSPPQGSYIEYAKPVPIDVRMNCIEYLPGNGIFITGGEDGNLYFWNINKLEPISKPTGGNLPRYDTVFIPFKKIENAHENAIIDISVSHNGDFFATKSLDSTVKLWIKPQPAINPVIRKTKPGKESEEFDYQQLEPLYEISSGSRCAGIAFSPSEEILLLATLGNRDTKVRVWKIDEFYFRNKVEF